MKNFITSIFLLLTAHSLLSQVIISDGLTSSTIPNNDAILELKSLNNNKGILMPKVSLLATNNPSPLNAHLAGITVYNTNTSTVNALTAVTPGFYFNDGSSWEKLEVEKPIVGDIKYSASSTDHDGWYLLDGRTVSSLPTLAATNASSLGFASFIPNASDRFLKTKIGSEVLGSSGGSFLITLTQANLPSGITYNGTTNITGNHSHQYDDRASGVTNSIEAGSTRTIVDNTSGTLTTQSSGNHNHTFTVSTGGSNTPINLTPNYLSTYTFVYLGQ